MEVVCCFCMEAGATSMEAGLLPNKLEEDVPPCKLVEASTDVDGSSWKSVGSKRKLCFD